jgi:hypothetical protein
MSLVEPLLGVEGPVTIGSVAGHVHSHSASRKFHQSTEYFIVSEIFHHSEEYFTSQRDISPASGIFQ